MSPLLAGVFAVAGAVLVLAVLISALETVVLPRGGSPRITRFVFGVYYWLFIPRRRGGERAARRQGLYAPCSLGSLPVMWMLLVLFGFGIMYWAIGDGTFADALVTSGSSLLTLGFIKPAGYGQTVLAFLEATIGLGLVALLISYLPTIYTSYATREKGVSKLSPLSGMPPTGVELVRRLNATQLTHTTSVWASYADWFADVSQSHSAFPALCYFPSQEDGESWVAAAGAILDGASLLLAASEGEPHVEGADYLVALANGVPALARVARAVGLPVDPPAPLVTLLAEETGDRDITISRAEFDRGWAQLEGFLASGRSPDEIWQRFATLRSAYDHAVRGLAGVAGGDATAPWTTDRPARVGRPSVFRKGRLRVDWTPSAP